MRALASSVAVVMFVNCGTWAQSDSVKSPAAGDHPQSGAGNEAVAPPGQRPANDSTLEALLQKGVEKGYPGMAMLVEDGQGRRRVAAAGFSDLEHHTRLRTTDAFQIASISKTFTAASVLRLIDDGKFSLQTTLKEALGDIVARIPYSEQITVAQLLDHSSGIYATNNDLDYLSTLLGAKADPKRIWTPLELIALADKDRRPPMGQPGSGHYYSDTNYILLGMIVEKAAGRPFKKYVAETWFRPLKMRSTYFYSDYLVNAAPDVSQPVQGYLLATKEIRSIIEINPMFKPVPGAAKEAGVLLNTTLAAERVDAAGGIVTTLSDLARFADPLFRGKLLSPASQKFLMAAGEEIAPRELNKHCTRTLQAMRKPYGVLIYKEGDGPGGINTLMAFLRSKDEIFIGFTNSFGHFDEVDFMMDEIIGPFIRD